MQLADKKQIKERWFSLSFAEKKKNMGNEFQILPNIC